ncbi:ribonuclease P protein component [Leekyejoonella antrihumi]|uniref:Ribonuclease P protein component n=1 Tax=Leekyejoonella antrihumi TaxID=1660198 RepID=A0A563E8W4_9MICO|nr:ribonuclease P protein component [Leekyejoonella antrihumi]TWP38254.1 ribonuclease P protein component [Leekyejoonella antrihumi]
MLAAAHRLRHGAEFTSVLRGRRSKRAGSRLLVVYAAAPKITPSDADPARVGFIVSKAVGNAVVRNRTKRRLRHLVSARLSTLDAGTDLVVRANPAAAGCDSATLGVDLDRLLVRTVGHAGQRGAQ